MKRVRTLRIISNPAFEEMIVFRSLFLQVRFELHAFSSCTIIVCYMVHYLRTTAIQGSFKIIQHFFFTIIASNNIIRCYTEQNVTIVTKWGKCMHDTFTIVTIHIILQKFTINNIFIVKKMDFCDELDEFHDYFD